MTYDLTAVAGPMQDSSLSVPVDAAGSNGVSQVCTYREGMSAVGGNITELHVQGTEASESTGCRCPAVGG